MPNLKDILPDKDSLYGEFQRGQRWRDRLAAKLAHKAVDIPEDEDVNLSVQHNGIGWRGLAVITAGLLGGGWLLKDAIRPAVPQPASSSPVDLEYEVRHYDAKGRLIDVPRLPKTERETTQ